MTTPLATAPCSQPGSCAGTACQAFVFVDSSQGRRSTIQVPSGPVRGGLNEWGVALNIDGARV
eukprot:8085728-Alexandrium_andersonii.AAC.1